MNLHKFVNTHTGKYVMSFLLGFGLATLFRVACTGIDCMVEMAPPLNEIDGKIYRFGDECFRMEKSAVKCDPNNKKILSTH